MKNKFLDAMMFRHATKEFDTDKKINDEDFEIILEMGRLSPSSFGFEPWHFVVIQNPQLREKLKTFVWGGQGQLLTASHFVIILARKAQEMKYDSEYISHMLNDVKEYPEEAQEMYKNFFKNFQEKDFCLLKSERALFDWSCKQVYIALSSMMNGAALMKIDTCAIEGFCPKATEEFLKDELNIDTQKFAPAVMVAFGYRKNDPRRPKSRQRQEDITTWYN